MIKSNLKTLVVIGLIILIIAVAAIYLRFKNNSLQQVNSISPSPFPLLQPTSTGANDVSIPPEQKDLITQKMALRQKIPLTFGNFQITYDYAQDKFIVTLSEPKTSTRQLFLQWLKNNYPAIPLDRFSIN